jgi:hypothetical protein
MGDDETSLAPCGLDHMPESAPAQPVKTKQKLKETKQN